MILKRSITVGELKDGINTLVVVAVDSKERSVAKLGFLASAPLAAKQEKGQPVLPKGIRSSTGLPVVTKSKALTTPKQQRQRQIEQVTQNVVPKASAIIRPQAKVAVR